MRYAIGIDIGGTKISAALGDQAGKILSHREIPTFTGARARDCLKALAVILDAMISESGIPRKKILGIGIGAPGAVNSAKGILPRSPNLPGWTGMPVRRVLENRFRVPVYLTNDANAAAIGELVFGAGKGLRHFVYITVSTGVGSGIVINGDLYEGAGFVAGELGHISIVPEGDKCNCGRRGCLEVYASGTAIARYAREMMKRRASNIKMMTGGGRLFGAKIVGLAAKTGDKVAVDSYEKAAYSLGIGLANLMNILNPEAIVIGGGVLKSAPRTYWTKMMRSAKGHAARSVPNHPDPEVHDPRALRRSRSAGACFQESMCAPVAQLDRASAFGAEGCRFKSCQARPILP